MTMPAEISATVGTTVERFLAQFPAEHRPESVHLALRALRARINDDLAILAELAHESYERGYWSLLKDEAGAAFLSPEAYFESVLGLGSWRSIYRYVVAGRLIASVPELEREAVRAAIAQVGVSKAAIVAPAIEARPDERAAWLERAGRETVAELQRHVTDVVTGATRGSGAAPGERFKAYIVAAMPDLESRDLVLRVFRRAARAGESNAVSAFVMMARVFDADLDAQGIAE